MTEKLLKLGVDLGTSNSVATIYKDNGETEVIPTPEGSFLCPSVVHYSGTEIIVGEKALELLKMGNENTVSHFKVDMGSVQKFNLAGREFTPTELSAEVLKYIKKYVEDYTGGKIGECVITTPAYFHSNQREETRKAGEMAGLKVSRIINEPTASSLSLGINLDEEQTILVVDVGGGTTDCSILTIGDGTVEVLGSNGNNHLGGKNFDEDLAKVILRTLKKVEKYQPSTENAIKALIEISRKVKEQLSEEDSVTVDLSILRDIDKTFKGTKNPVVVTRKDFEHIIGKYVEEIKRLAVETVREADMEFDEVDKILLVGGSIRIPIFTTALEEASGIPVIKGEIDPDLSVSVGAAIQTAILTGANKDMVLLDVIPFSLSIETADGMASKVIKANSNIPISRSKIYTTSMDNQKTLEFDIYQGNLPIAKENEFLGRITLTDIPPAKKGIPQIEVTFRIDENGELEVTATDIMTFKSMSIKRSINNK